MEVLLRRLATAHEQGVKNRQAIRDKSIGALNDCTSRWKDVVAADAEMEGDEADKYRKSVVKAIDDCRYQQTNRLTSALEQREVRRSTTLIRKMFEIYLDPITLRNTIESCVTIAGERPAEERVSRQSSSWIRNSCANDPVYFNHQFVHVFKFYVVGLNARAAAEKFETMFNVWAFHVRARISKQRERQTKRLVRVLADARAALTNALGADIANVVVSTHGLLASLEAVENPLPVDHVRRAFGRRVDETAEMYTARMMANVIKMVLSLAPAPAPLP